MQYKDHYRFYFDMGQKFVENKIKVSPKIFSPGENFWLNSIILYVSLYARVLLAGLGEILSSEIFGSTIIMIPKPIINEFTEGKVSTKHDLLP